MAISPTDTTAELVKLGEAKTLGGFDDDDASLWNVDADFDDRSGDENLSLAFSKAVNDLIFLLGL